ncbi:MAG TPA: LLM class F420-dependent oxidoreductase [Actinomycetota bacterium]|nr:LLM class F420-dependent oxidoreductase [Actinomycetota bacterium]
MDFGLHLPSAGAGVTADGIREVAVGAEGLGFDTVWMFDHLFTPTGLESKYPYTSSGNYAVQPQDPFFDPLGLFGVIAGATSRVKMATGVLIAAYRHPIVLAKTIATIDNFAPGRIVLGVGAGWMREEFEGVGVGYDRRGARLEEYIRALRAIWSGDPVAFEGEFYSWQEAGFLPAPTAPIPIVIGGHGDRALRRAARVGDGWAVVTAPGQGAGLDGASARIDLLKRFLDEEGRDPAKFTLSYQQALWFSDHTNAKLPLTGPPDAVAGSIKRLEEMGVSMLDLIVLGPPALVLEIGERFQKEVVPLL